MKWRTPQVGDTRTRRVFTFIPQGCNDGQTRWLEWLVVTENYFGLFTEWRAISFAPLRQSATEEPGK